VGPAIRVATLLDGHCPDAQLHHQEELALNKSDEVNFFILLILYKINWHAKVAKK
jgi:hypothetical protein